jgi:hypothetical protein
MGDVFILVCNFRVPLVLKVDCPSSGVSCDVALVFIFLCVGLMDFFFVLRFPPVSLLLVCILLFLSRDISAAGGVFCVFRCYCVSCSFDVVWQHTHTTGCKHPRLRQLGMQVKWPLHVLRANHIKQCAYFGKVQLDFCLLGHNAIQFVESQLTLLENIPS